MVKVKSNKKAFSLMEVIFYMVLVGILIGIAVPNLGKLKEKAELTVIKADTGSVRNMALLEGIDSNLPIKDNSLKQGKGKLYLNGELVDSLDISGFYEVNDSIYKDSGTKLDGGFYINDKYDVVYVDDAATKTESLEDMDDDKVISEYSTLTLKKNNKYYVLSKKQYNSDVLTKDGSGNITHGPLFEYLKVRQTVSISHYGLSTGDIYNNRFITRADYTKANIKYQTHYKTLTSEYSKLYSEMDKDFLDNLYTISYTMNGDNVVIKETKVN